MKRFLQLIAILSVFIVLSGCAITRDLVSDEPVSSEVTGFSGLARIDPLHRHG